MSKRAEGKCVFFEPWGLGDALIAAGVARHDPARNILACAEKWRPIVEAALQPIPLPIVGIEIPYGDRIKKSKLPFGTMRMSEPSTQIQKEGISEILSIRGDPRDFISAKLLFSNAPIRMSGWLPFAARRIAPLDGLLGLLRIPVRNRYRAWAALAGVPFSEVEARYAEERRESGKAREKSSVAIHLGAQWKSRQYPFVLALRETLQTNGYAVTLFAGPNDSLPVDLKEADIERISGIDLVQAFRRFALVVANDSGPMHLAALLGAPTLVPARVSQIAEWVPPGVEFLDSPLMPRGYRPDAAYESDRQLTDWPTPEAIARKIALYQ